MIKYALLSALYGIYFFILGASISYISDAIFPPLKTYKNNYIIGFEVIAQVAVLAILSHYSMGYFRNTKSIFEYIGLSNKEFRSHVIQNSGNIIIPFAILLFQHRLNTKVVHLKYKLNDYLIGKGLLEESDRQKNYNVDKLS